MHRPDKIIIGKRGIIRMSLYEFESCRKITIVDKPAHTIAIHTQRSSVCNKPYFYSSFDLCMSCQPLHCFAIGGICDLQRLILAREKFARVPLCRIDSGKTNKVGSYQCSGQQEQCKCSTKIEARFVNSERSLRL